jgi:anaerobic selenocysteine-containing dehydrogenase
VQTLGGKVGMKVEFFAESQLILIWGSNSIGSNLHFWRYAQQAKRNGAKLVCIDPRKSETADKCHEHIALRPGTDAALALALMHELIANDWLDHDYIARHTLGWEHCASAPCSGRPSARPRSAAFRWSRSASWPATTAPRKPAAIRLNYGMQRVRGGGNAVRAVACLPALTAPGATARAAAAVQLGPVPGERAALQRPDLLARAAAHHQHVHHWRRPAARGSPGFGPKIEALVVYNSNPVAVAPESGKVVQGFAREDLFTVVLEHFHTDTADYADYILPATTQLEHWDVHLAYGHTDVLLNRPAIAPLGQARSNAQIFRDLAARMGFTDPCFADTTRRCAARPLATRWTYALLKRQGFATLALPDAPFAEGGFPTPSGKCEFFSERLAAQGLDGLPDHLPNHELQGTSARIPAGHDLAAGAQLPQLHLRQREEPARHRRPPAAGDPPRRRRQRAALPDGAVVRVFNDRAATAATPRCRPARTPRRGQRPGHLVAQAGAGRHQREPAHQPGADRPGPRADVL